MHSQLSIHKIIFVVYTLDGHIRRVSLSDMSGGPFDRIEISGFSLICMWRSEPDMSSDLICWHIQHVRFRPSISGQKTFRYIRYTNLICLSDRLDISARCIDHECTCHRLKTYQVQPNISSDMSRVDLSGQELNHERHLWMPMLK